MKILIGITSFLFVVLSAHAEEDDGGYLSMKRPDIFASEYKPHVGLLAGVSTPEGDGDDNAEVGIDIGYQPKPTKPVEVGAEFTHAMVDDGLDETARNTVLLKATYNFESDTALIKDSYAGIGAGAVFESDDTLAVAAPIVGFDIPVTKQIRTEDYMTLGANARYAFVEDETDTFTLAGAVKYWY